MMNKDEQLATMLLDLQEHPERVTDEGLRRVLSDAQLHALVEQLAFAKRAFVNEEARSEAVNVVDEWERFAARHADELDALQEKTMKPEPTSRRTLRFVPRLQGRAAAILVGVLVASGLTVAAILAPRLASSPSEGGVGQPALAAGHDAASPATLPDAATVVFDNVPLDSMLCDMAGFYGVGVAFEREETRRLRFYFVWKRSDTLDRLVEKLNNFEAIDIVRESETLIVR